MVDLQDRRGTNHQAVVWYSKQKAGSLYITRRSASSTPGARPWQRSFRVNGWSATGSTKDDETEGEIAEKEEELTARTRACSQKPKEDRSGRISLETVQEEEDHVNCSSQLVSILCSETALEAG
jgi:hypothetical protein